MSPRNLTPKQQREIELIRESEYFDADYYLQQNPKLAESGNDPATHYYLRGPRTRKNPSPRFSTKNYLDRYSDVRQRGDNPLVHFLLIGQAEGRSPDPLGEETALIEESGLFDE